MTHGVIDLFSGPRGWDVGLRMLGRDDSIGVENDAMANATARTNGFVAVDGDVSAIDPHDFADEHCDGQPDGLIASPVCRPFSNSGHGLGREDMESILSVVQDIANGEDPDEVIPDVVSYCLDSLSPLSLEPLRWALALRPRWLAWEQVPQVRPLWVACADVLRARGYNVWTGTLSAEQYEVPQTRKRQVLIANLEHAVMQPAPVCSRYHSRTPWKLDLGLRKWVSMADAIGSAMPDDEWMLSSGTRPNSRMRASHEPSVTLAFGNDASSFTIVPAGTKVEDLPGLKASGDARRITPREAAQLQSFPEEHVFCGTQGDTYRQIGDAVPPLLAMHVLRAAGAIQ